MRKKSTLEFAIHEKRSLSSDDDEEFSGIQERDRHSLILPSHSTSAEITGLATNSVFIVEIHASVDSSDGELHGEKGIVFIRTSGPEVPRAKIEVEPIRTDKPDKSEELTVQEPSEPSEPSVSESQGPAHLEIQKPHFDMELQTQLNWGSHESCRHLNPSRLQKTLQDPRSFSVRVRKTLCREYQPNHHSDTRWHDLRVSECSVTLKGLSFDCDYKVEVTDTVTQTTVVDGVFSTDSCEATPALSPIDCSTITSPIQCHVSSESSAYCHWTRHHDPLQTVIGYRILLSSPVNHDTNTTINQPQLREVRYEDLQPGYVYTVEVGFFNLFFFSLKKIFFLNRKIFEIFQKTRKLTKKIQINYEKTILPIF